MNEKHTTITTTTTTHARREGDTRQIRPGRGNQGRGRGRERQQGKKARQGKASQGKESLQSMKKEATRVAYHPPDRRTDRQPDM